MLLLLLLIAALMSACAAASNALAESPIEDGEPAGFWHGLWHGFIAPFAFIGSFKANVDIYEAHNNGG